MARPSGRDIRGAALMRAEEAMQARGVARLSYGDLARRVGVRAPTLHHHFRRKEDLVSEVTARYCDRFDDEVAAIDSETAPVRLDAYAALFERAAEAGMVCLCGAVTADWPAVGGPTRAAVAGFFARQRAWLSREVARGQARGELRTEVDPDTFAFALLAALEGCLLIERAADRPRAARAVCSELVSAISC